MKIQQTRPTRGLVVAWLLLLFQLGSTAYLGWRGLRLPFDNRIDRFAVENQEVERSYGIFKSAFAAPEYVLVLIEPKERLPQKRWPQAESLFEQLSKQHGVAAYQSLATTIPAGIDFQLEALPFPFINKDRTCYAAIFEWRDGPSRQEDLQAFLDFTQQQEMTRDAFRKIVVAGEPIVNHQLNHSSQEVKNRFFPLLIGFSLCFLAWLFRSWKVLLTAGLAIASALTWTLGLMALLNEPLNLVTTLIPALIFVLAVAMQVHVLIGIGYQRDLLKGVKSKIPPNFLVAFTTSLGFGSLMLSQVQPITTMGRFMAMGIWIIFIWSHLTHWGISRILALQVQVPQLPYFSRLIRSPRYSSFSKQRIWLFVFAGFILLGGWWLPKNPTESNGLMYFHPGHPIRQTTHYLQTHLTGASQLELLLPAQGHGGDWPRDFEPLARLEAQIRHMPGVRHILSPQIFASFASNISPLPMDATAGYHFLAQTQAALLDSYRTPDYYRIQLIVDSLDRHAYDRLHDALTSALANTAWHDQAIITGPLSRIIEIQRYLLTSLSKSLGITVGFVLLLMMIFLRVWRSPGLILLPNLLPLAFMVLMMGILGIKTTISSVMVFSIAFGIAVDDTIHLLHTYFKRPEPQFWDRWQATFLRDAKAISLTSLVLASGFLILVTSSFSPTRDFGLLMAIGMVSALLSDLACLPILLRPLDSRRNAKQPSANAAG